jgi:predicted nucleic-acid-binding Zn-ribbon protein
MFSSADLLLAAGKRKNLLVTGGFRNDFTESQAASFYHFQCKNCSFKVFEARYWKHFQNL